MWCMSCRPARTGTIAATGTIDAARTVALVSPPSLPPSLTCQFPLCRKVTLMISLLVFSTAVSEKLIRGYSPVPRQRVDAQRSNAKQSTERVRTHCTKQQQGRNKKRKIRQNPVNKRDRNKAATGKPIETPGKQKKNGTAKQTKTENENTSKEAKLGQICLTPLEPQSRFGDKQLKS